MYTFKNLSDLDFYRLKKLFKEKNVSFCVLGNNSIRVDTVDIRNMLKEVLKK